MSTYYRKKSRIGRCLLWFGVLVYCLAIPVGSEGLVICVGSEDHVAVEIASGGGACCPHSSKAQQEPTYSPSKKSTHNCDPCVDSPISFVGSERSIVPAKNIASDGKIQAGRASPFTLSQIPNNVAGNFPLRPPFPTNRSLDSLSTIVLLI